jgi:DNA repair protein RecO (recombination protein O)
MLCGSCRLPGSANPSPEAVTLLAALLGGNWSIAEAVDSRHRKTASGIVAAYLQWHLERSLRSLIHVER